MRRPFVSQLRARPGTIVIGDGSRGCITIRVQGAELWDAIRIEVPPEEPVLTVKLRALEALYPDAEFHEDFALKLGGFEVLDEQASLAEAGARDGSIFLLQYRRRRPIR